MRCRVQRDSNVDRRIPRHPVAVEIFINARWDWCGKGIKDGIVI